MAKKAVKNGRQRAGRARLPEEDQGGGRKENRRHATAKPAPEKDAVREPRAEFVPGPKTYSAEELKRFKETDPRQTPGDARGAGQPQREHHGCDHRRVRQRELELLAAHGAGNRCHGAREDVPLRVTRKQVRHAARRRAACASRTKPTVCARSAACSFPKNAWKRSRPRRPARNSRTPACPANADGWRWQV